MYGDVTAGPVFVVWVWQSPPLLVWHAGLTWIVLARLGLMIFQLIILSLQAELFALS